MQSSSLCGNAAAGITQSFPLCCAQDGSSCGRL